MPQHTTAKLQVRVEGALEAGQKLSALEKQVRATTEKFAKVEMDAQRAALTGIKLIEFDRVQKLDALVKEFKKQQQQIEQSGFGDREAIQEKFKELERQAAEARVAINLEADAKIAQSQEKTFTLMSKRLGSFVDRWGKGAKNLGVVWDRIQNEMALSLSKFLFRMLFQWDVALKAMQELTKRGFLGSLFSLGGGIPGSTGSLFGTIGGLAGTITGSRVAHTSRRDVCGSRVNIEAAR